MGQTLTIHEIRAHTEYTMGETGRYAVTLPGQCAEYRDRNYDIECIAEREIHVPDEITVYEGEMGDLCVSGPLGVAIVTDLLDNQGRLCWGDKQRWSNAS